MAAPSLPSTSASQIPSLRPDDCVKILLATDNHIGYNERDPIRGQDSINTFKEILELAIENDVDMLLLAGDLFHENKPSRAALYQTISLLRQYTMGRRPIALELISDAGIGITHDFNFPQINYEDENLNVGLPVFSIHGNHDDPQGAGPDGALCALDILSASGLINYFGRQELPGNAADDEAAREQGIHVKPILLQKGGTKLAMYGVGNMRDERFHAEMRHNRISMFRPAEDADDWFNLLLIHQNRAARGVKNSVPENGFGNEVHLVVWGHEHDCRITPESVAGRDYRISQPGSSVATSLAAGEALQKHVAILKIQDKNYQMDPIPLRTVRPFIFEEVVLADEREEGAKLENKAAVNKFLKRKVEDMIKKADEQWESAPDRKADEPKMLPLIRLRVDYSSTPDEPFEVGNPQRFGQEFSGRVANPKDVVQFHKRKNIQRKKRVNIDQPEGMDVDEEDEDADLASRIEKVKVETLVHEYLQAQQLQVIAENGMSGAVDDFVDKQEKDAIKMFVKQSLSVRREEVIQAGRTEDLDSDAEIEKQIDEAKSRQVDEIEKNPDSWKKVSSKSKSKAKGKAALSDDDEMSDFDKLSASDSAKKGKKKAAPKKAAADKTKPLFNQNESEEEEHDSEALLKKKKAAPATKKAAAPKKATTAKAKQTALDFAPSRGSGSTSRAASSRAQKNIPVEISDDDSSEVDYGVQDDEERAPKRKRK